VDTWDGFVEACKRCRNCSLCETRTNVVVGRGTNLKAPVMFIGEGPGEQEDIEGSAFVGRAGKLLDLALEALMFEPGHYYIANIVKCRPPGNRVPSEAEAQACLPWLRYQVKYIKPSIIVCLGSTAARHIIDKGFKITQGRGTWIEMPGYFSILPTYHPSAVLRDPGKKMDFFQDLKQVRTRIQAQDLW
jgi:uracil-DNA glycosylase family 4